MKQISRSSFLKRLIAGAIFLPHLAALASDLDQLRGDRVGWARLKTPSPYWNRHSGSDPVLMNFFREQTTLNIDPTWYAADVNDLAEMCKYPFLFSQGVGMVTDPSARANLAEFIRRGGFLLMDACNHHDVTPDFDDFIRDQVAFFADALPEARMVPIPSTHEIYRCYFQIPDGRPPHTFMAGVYDERKAQHGLYSMMIGQRMVAVISVCGLQCGWDHVTAHPVVAPPGHDQACMRMLVNIYVYAMMQGS